MCNQERKKVTYGDTDIVHNLVEQCLIHYMNRKQVIDILWEKYNIEPNFTKIIWHKLEEDNQEFFKKYYAMLMVKDQVAKFNNLLSRQVVLMNQVNSSGVVSQTMPNRSHIPPAAPVLPAGFNNGGPSGLQLAFDVRPLNMMLGQNGPNVGMLQGMNGPLNVGTVQGTNGPNVGTLQGMNGPNEGMLQRTNRPNVGMLQGMNGPNVGMLQGTNGPNVLMLHGRNGLNVEMLQGRNGPNVLMLQGRNGPNVGMLQEMSEPNAVMLQGRNGPNVLMLQRRNGPNVLMLHGRNGPNVGISEGLNELPNDIVMEEHPTIDNASFTKSNPISHQLNGTTVDNIFSFGHLGQILQNNIRLPYLTDGPANNRELVSPTDVMDSDVRHHDQTQNSHLS